MRMNRRPVMLVPALSCWPSARSSPGLSSRYYFIGADESLFWSTSIYRAPENEIVHQLHEVPFLISLLPFLMLLGGAGIAYYVLYPPPGCSASASPR